MPYRIIPFINDQYYHVYNRGSEKRRIFESRRDYQHFIKTLHYYQLEGPKPKLSKYFKYNTVKLDQNKKIVEVICYCLMPNHFHFLIKQVKNGGVTEFLSKLSNSYTRYYNTKYDRVGPLLQGEFKAVLIENDSQLVHTSRYIHLNPLTSLIVKDLNFYEWSSYREYIKGANNHICDKDIILNLFKSPEDYLQFVMDQADYAQEIETIKHQLIDEE